MNDTTHLVLADAGVTPYVIVAPNNATAAENHAACELRDLLSEATGAAFPLVDDTHEPAEQEILVGNTNRGISLPPDLAPEELVVRTMGASLSLVGGGPRGTLYAVYHFLESVVGCRWFTTAVSTVPHHNKLVVEPLDVRITPALEYREVFYTEAFDGDWAARNYMNSSQARLEEKHGGRVQYGRQAFVHTFGTLVPVSEHFGEHPEWFSEVDGQRIAERTQLCLTNPDVLDLAIRGVRRWIEEEPEATIFSVSQDDWQNPCCCANCAELDEREGSHAGTMLWFANQVAEAIEDEAPHVAIDTLAYQYTRKPPRTIRPRPNVIVRLCSIECCFAHSFEACPENASFVDDVVGWSRIADRLYVWDYVTNFKNYIMPWPNFRVLGPNIRFLARHNVVGIFEEGNHASGGGGELSELRSYVLAKLLWDTDVDEEHAADEFIDSVYGAAAPHVRSYLKLIHDTIKPPENHLYTTVARISPFFDNPHITSDVIERGDALLSEAESILKSPEIRERVELLRLPMQFIRIRRMDDGSRRQNLIERFRATAKRAGITQIAEGYSLDRWIEQGARAAQR
jgi:hypothetical protein